MLPVAGSDGVTIHCPADGRYAFYNSPYPAHRLMTGIDVYPEAVFGESAHSPVEGVVTLVRRVKAPTSHLFESSGYDTVTIIRSRETPGRVAKLLHVDTILDEGGHVDVGDDLGPLIRSGYFGYNTLPHVHLEVRSADDPLRVRGGRHIRSLLTPHGPTPSEEMKGVVIASRHEYSLVQLDHKAAGTVADIGGASGILDGGVPLYGWFGAHTWHQPKTEEINLLGKQIGRITSVMEGTCIAQCTPFEIRLEGVPVNVFFFLRPDGKPQVAATSVIKGRLQLELKSRVEFTIESPGDA